MDLSNQGHLPGAQAGQAVKGTGIQVTRETFDNVTRGKPFHVRHLLSALCELEYGRLTIELPNGERYRFIGKQKGPDASVVLGHWRALQRAKSGGSIGLAESYMDGEWHSDDVTTFLELFSLNYDLSVKVGPTSLLRNVLFKLRHWMNENTKLGSKRNIAAHYDLGNDFYSLWLDASMTYSSGVYEKRANSLEAAQQAKYRSLIQKAEIGENDHVLEIGCGWGGFAEYAAKHAKARVTALTISRRQLEFAKKRIFKAGLNEKVEFKFQDYRDERSEYDRIASIEMFEAVGEKYWDVYFSKIRNCLKQGGRAGLQIITIADERFKRYKNHPDFIQRYIFPGGMLPSPSILTKLVNNAGLREDRPHIFGHDYARTLAQWRHNFGQKWDEICQLGFDDRFRRMWEFYLHYCEAGFRSKNIDVRQVFLTKN